MMQKEIKMASNWLVYGALGLTGINFLLSVFGVTISMFDFLVALTGFLAVTVGVYNANKFKFKNKLDLVYFGILAIILAVVTVAPSVLGLQSVIASVAILSGLYSAFMPVATGALIGLIVCFIVGLLRGQK